MTMTAASRPFERRRSIFRRVALVLCASLALAPHADASARQILDRGSIEIGLASSTLDGDIAVNGSALGTDIDLSRDLDIGGHDQGELFAARWRPFDRHEFGLRGQHYGRSGERTISRDIVFDDEVFTINSRIRGEIDLDVWTANYTGWLVANPDRAFGLSIGALQYRLALKLAAKNLPGGVQPEPIRAQVSEDLPVLVAGAEYRERLSDRWRIVLRAAVFQARINSIDGTVVNLDAGVEYAFTERLALALRYAQTRLDAEASRSELTGRLHLDLTNVQTALIWHW
jgi:hypothetical protein